MTLKYPLRLKWTREHEAFCLSQPIFLKHPAKIEGVFKVGDNVRIDRKILIEPYATMPAKAFMQMGAFSYSISALDARTRVGRYCSISWDCAVMGIAHPTERITTHVMSFRKYYTDAMRQWRGDAPDPVAFEVDKGPVIIGNDVWIGQNVLIQQGVRIGDGAVVAAGAIVTKDVEPYAIVAGVPAKRLRYRLPEEVRERARAMRWWNYAPDQLAGLSMEDPVAFLDGLEQRIAAGLEPFAPTRIDIGLEFARLSGLATEA